MGRLFYEDDRNSDFMQACDSIKKKEGNSLSVKEIASKAVHEKAKSFYLHPSIYLRILKDKGNNLPKRKMSRDLHLEILKRADLIKKENKDLSINEIATLLSEQQAPRFYMSESRAVSLYYELLNLDKHEEKILLSKIKR